VNLFHAGKFARTIAGDHSYAGTLVRTMASNSFGAGEVAMSIAN